MPVVMGVLMGVVMGVVSAAAAGVKDGSGGLSVAAVTVASEVSCVCGA